MSCIASSHGEPTAAAETAHAPSKEFPVPGHPGYDIVEESRTVHGGIYMLMGGSPRNTMAYVSGQILSSSNGELRMYLSANGRHAFLSIPEQGGDKPVDRAMGETIARAMAIFMEGETR